jgi:hypothetical protein
MEAWTNFFFGTPKRFLWTLAGFMVLFGLFFPQVIGSAVHNLLNALLLAITPFVKPVLTLGIIFLALGIMLRAVWPKKKGK